MSAQAQPLFPNYTQLKQRVPQWVWYIARMLTVSLGVAVIITLIVRPDAGLFVFWRLIVPVLPLLFFVAPGLWRNICPMAALNQTPRLFNFSRSLTLPPRAKEYAYIIGIVLFFLIVPTRKALFNTNGLALALLLLAAFSTAFFGGFFFKGKSGWCSSICPLLPVQRLYGQTPFVNIPNNHCKPCVGCAKNCFDFNPAIANMADQYDNDEHYRGYRKFFAAAFPGLVLAFYLVPNPPDITIPLMYFEIALIILVSVGLYYGLTVFTRLTAPRVTTLFGAVALNLYYAYNLPIFADTVQTLTGATLPQVVVLVGQAVVLVLTLWWIYRSFTKEPLFLSQSNIAVSQIKANAALVRSLTARRSRVIAGSSPEVTFEPGGKRILATPGTTLLELVEANNLPLESGCRMGVCGADPVAIVEGVDNLSAVGSDERTTLERLGLAANTRMACCARVQGGALKVALQPQKASAKQLSIVANFDYDKSVNSVVIIGNGIAGITAADHVRRRHPTCEIHVVSREPHHLYNRMGLTRLIYGRSAMKGLYLLPENWYDDYQITTWLNTLVTRIDRQEQKVYLAEGDALPYDRLIIATGSAGRIPHIPGYGIPGSFVLREAADAIAMRAYAQERHCSRAVVAGGGLLGLEAAYALHKLGLEVDVLERGEWLMRRQLDERGAAFLQDYLSGIGVNVLLKAEVSSLHGAPDLRQIVLKDGRLLTGEIFLVCAGIIPNIDVVKAAGLDTRQGVLVDEHMRSSDPLIYAAGDVAESSGEILGLWTAAVEQAEVAAANAVGLQQTATYTGIVPTTMLKVAGIDLMSIGVFESRSEQDTVIALEDTNQHQYRKLVVADGRIIGAILLGFPRLAPMVKAAILDAVDITALLPQLRAGDWEALQAVVHSP